MLDWQRGRIVFECDGCGESLEPGTGDFESAREELRTEGWIARNEGTQASPVWTHYCSVCKND